MSSQHEILGRVNDLLETYVANVGHQPPQAPAEHAWQWSYSGKPNERELLLDLIQAEAEAQAEQMSLC